MSLNDQLVRIDNK